MPELTGHRLGWAQHAEHLGDARQYMPRHRLAAEAGSVKRGVALLRTSSVSRTRILQPESLRDFPPSRCAQIYGLEAMYTA